jgi:lipid A 4'-phosphatase
LSYLKLLRGRAIIGCALLSSLLLVALPGVDIYISGLFFDRGFYLNSQWWQILSRQGIGYFLGLSLVGVVGIYAFNRLTNRAIWRVDGRRVCYLFLVLILGAGLVVNVGLKDNFGRARPRDIVEFGGAKSFTPAFSVSRECTKNCSFSSGEGAGGFFSLALALALSRKRALFAAAIGFGSLVSFARIAAGAHFFSDTVVSFFVMLIAADVLYFYVVMTGLDRSNSARSPPQMNSANLSV